MTDAPVQEVLANDAWRERVRRYAEADDRIAAWQVMSTLALYAALLVAMAWSLRCGYWLTLLLSLPAGGVMVRLFVLFHDCCHLSLFRSRRANEWIGALLGPFVLTPYFHWRLEHNHHHATAGNVDKRGVGDIPTLLASEYARAGLLKRLGYRVLRHPLFLFTVGSFATFVALQRFWGGFAGARERRSVVATDAAIVAIVVVAGHWCGFASLACVMAPTIFVAAAAGLWLFYVQHQFPGAYWRRNDSWSFRDAAMRGSSFYDLPPVLRYLSGNIGFHHIHHLSPKIPNYRLRDCHRGEPELQVAPLGIAASFACVFIDLIDDDTLTTRSFTSAAQERTASKRSTS